jgi:hypothetical protein
MGLSRIQLVVAVMLSGFAVACSSSSNSSSTSSSRTINANTTAIETVSTTFNGTSETCSLLSRDASSCTSARTALGLSGNWLSFSCNVVLGLADASKNSTTSYSSAKYVTLAVENLPDYTSNYWPTTGSYSFTANGYTVTGNDSDLYVAFTVPFNDPNKIGARSATMYVPITPAQAAAKSQIMSMGTVGMALNGVFIYDSVAGNTDNIFSEGGSFDQCGGHPDTSSSYHYHSEPYSISYDDNKLIGVMMDGFFVYGRKDYAGTYPGSIANYESAGNTSDIYVYGGHVGSDPIANTGSTFHYHLTEWKGCYHESGTTKSSDDGVTFDTINTPTNPACGGYYVDAWMLTGHGNGGVYNTIPTGIGTQAPSQTATAIRYYYGTPGSCTNCP